jgi:hypothetical protein
VALSALLAALVLLVLLAARPPAAESASLVGSSATAWRLVGGPALVDVPRSFGLFLDLVPFRAGQQTLVVALHDQSSGRLRVVTLLGRLIGEASVGGFTPRATLAAGWRLFVWGQGPQGSARLWTPAFTSAHALSSLDPQLPCRTATNATTPLAGPFTVTIPLDAKPGGQVVPSPTNALVFGNPASPAAGVRIATAGGVTLGKTTSGANVARGGFSLAGAVFAYGTAGGQPRLWTPTFVGSSSSLVSSSFVACTAAPPAPFDGTATPVLDPAHAVTATIGRDGGSLTAGGMQLAIPAGALSESVAITMTPMTGLDGSPLDSSFIGGANLAPEGLRFLKPAVLSMPLPAGVQPKDVLGFGSAGNGSDLHLVLREVQAGRIAIELWHFSTGGASSGGAAAASAMQSYQPTSAEGRAMQRIAAATPGCEAERASGIFNGPACTHLEQETVRALFDWYANAVKPALEQAVGAPSFQLEAALQEWLSWAATVAAKLNGELQNELSQAKALASDAVADFANRRLNNCTGTSLASQLRDVGRVADFVQAGDVDLAAEGLPADLLRACAHLKIEVLEFPAVAALLYANTLRGRVTVDVYSGADRTDVPFTLTVDGAPVSAAGDGSFQTTITPSATPVNVPLEATATNVALQNTSFGARTILARPARERVELEALGPVAISPDGTVTLRARVAGDGMAGTTVNYSSQGIGSLGATSGTTNEQGEAPVFVYTAPSDPEGGDATIAAAFGDATDSVAITVASEILVTVSPGSVTLTPGETRQFAATVTGTPNTAVTWTKTGGEITQSGLYTAGNTPGSFTVTATSVEDPAKSASATVTIGGPAHITLIYDYNSHMCNHMEDGTVFYCEDSAQHMQADLAVDGSVQPDGSIRVHVTGSFGENASSNTYGVTVPHPGDCHSSHTFNGTVDDVLENAYPVPDQQFRVVTAIGTESATRQGTGPFCSPEAQDGQFAFILALKVVTDASGKPVALDFGYSRTLNNGPNSPYVSYSVETVYQTGYIALT